MHSAVYKVFKFCNSICIHYIIMMDLYIYKFLRKKLAGLSLTIDVGRDYILTISPLICMLAHTFTNSDHECSIRHHFVRGNCWVKK